MSAREMFAIEDYNTYSKPIAILSDLGLSRRIEPENPLCDTRCGSEDYASPELIMGKLHDGKLADSWALGVLLYAIMEGKLPFDHSSNTSASRRRRNSIAHRIARIEWAWRRHRECDGESGWADAKAIVEGCLQRSDTRKTATEIAAMDWVQTNIAAEMVCPWSFDIAEVFR